MKEIIKLETSSVTSRSETKRSMPCVASPSRYTKESSSPSWEPPDRGNRPAEHTRLPRYTDLGRILPHGVAVRTMDKNQRATLRNRKIGFVFQNYNLLPKTTAIENVELPLMYNSSCTASERYRRAVEALRAVGLGDRLLHKSNQMSGGQMQRVAIARAW